MGCCVYIHSGCSLRTVTLLRFMQVLSSWLELENKIEVLGVGVSVCVKGRGHHLYGYIP